MITDLALLKQQLVRIENIKTWLVDIPKIHPDNDKYIRLWSKYTKMCIEGLWGYDSGGWRYMPGTLFFYGNFFSIKDVDEEQNVRIYKKPTIRDLDWMIHYAYLECLGFIGWSEDDEYTSDPVVLDYLHAHEVPKKKLHVVSSKGKLKEYIHARDNIRNLHDKKLGVPLYSTPTKNLNLFGARGGGKSFTMAGITAHHLTFDGLKYFTDDLFENPPNIEICVGSGQTEKSSEWCTKVKEGLKAFGTNNDLGVWGRAEKGDEDYTPNPFYRDWLGSLDIGNKKNPFRYEYSAKIGNRWIDGLGTKSQLVHVNYSDKKQGGAEAAAGGRYILVVYEEVGLMSNIISAWLSNTSTVKDGNGKQFGVQIAIGTSGNIELVQQSKKMFHNPGDYDCLKYDDIWENSGTVGFFLPAYLTNNDYKDANGNTDIEAALAFYAEERMKAASKADPEILRMEKMNNPLVPSDMWISSKGAYFPIGELKGWEKKLIRNAVYKTEADSVNITWDSSNSNGIKVEVDPTLEPFYEFPYTRNMSKIDGAIQIYQKPVEINGEIPKDMYFFVFDPYVSDNIDEGGSLGAFYGFMNPKYTIQGYNGGSMVCAYVGKHPDGRDGFHSNIEKIIAYYGDCPRSLWYENNRGDNTRSFFAKRKKTHLLALEPVKEKGSSIHLKKTQNYGIPVYGDDKLTMIGDAADYLTNLTTYNGIQVRGYETIFDIFLIRQMIAFELKKSKNFDAVSAFILAPFVIRELEHTRLDEITKKHKHNPLAVLSINPRVFKEEGIRHKLERFNHNYSKYHESPTT